MGRGEVLVVGAGPVGLSLCTELLKHGANFRVIDKNAFIDLNNSRSAGIHARTIEILEDMGVVDQFLAAGVKAKVITFRSEDETLLQAEYERFDSPYCYILSVPQHVQEKIFIEHLKRSGIFVQRGIELIDLREDSSDGFIVAKLKNLVTKEVYTEPFNYIVGCDGARSICRKLLKTPFPGYDYEEGWFVFDGTVKFPESEDLDIHNPQVFIGSSGVGVFFPIPGDRIRAAYTSSLTLKDIRQQTGKTVTTVEEAKKALERVTNQTVEISDVSTVNHYFIHQRQATEYKKGRLFLCGDACHLQSPVGGQGLNVGIQDAYNLGGKLALVLNGLSSVDILNTYFLERHIVAKEALDLTGGLTNIISVKGAFMKALVKTGLKLLNASSFFSQLPAKKGCGLFIEYPIVNNSLFGFYGTPLKTSIGTRAPDHLVSRVKNNETTRLFELFKGPHFSMLVLLPNQQAIESKTLKDEIEEVFQFEHVLCKRCVILSHCDQLKKLPGLTEEVQSICFTSINQIVKGEGKSASVFAHYGVLDSHGALVIVRPDGYIGYTQSILNIAKAKEYFNKIFNNAKTSL